MTWLDLLAPALVLVGGFAAVLIAAWAETARQNRLYRAMQALERESDA